MAACISSGLLLFRLRFKHFRLKEHFRYLKGVSRLGTRLKGHFVWICGVSR